MTTVTGTMAATETNSDSLTIVINVYTPETSATSQAGAKVSVVEVGTGDNPVSIQIPES